MVSDQSEMMFDPPDFPYNELSDTMRDHYGPDDLLFSNNLEPTVPLPSMNKNLTDVTEQIISNVESQLMLNSNDSGRHFSVENTTYNIENIQNAELFVVQSDMFNYESTLLDDNTVNQFLLPLQGTESNGPDLLALHSCVICHEIFTTDADLLDHTVLVHASDNSMDPNQNTLQPVVMDTSISQTDTNTTSSTSFETEWLVCGVCARVLSTALEVEPSEQLCCSSLNGKSNVVSRTLDTMFVCDYCSGLFADGEAIDNHRLTCFAEDQPGYYETDTTSEGHSFPEPFFKCDTCGKQTVTADELRRHVVDVHLSKKVPTKAEKRMYTASNNNKMWNCGSCNQLFATARELYRHKRGEDRPPGAPLTAYVCEDCDKVLGSMCALHTHKKMHKVSKPGYPCRICGRRFNQSGHLAIHMRMHTGERPYPCDLCPKAFKVKVERDDHRRTHTGERPFACTACPKTFTAAARLREHARIHTDQRPYRCDICGAAFRRPYARTVHTLIHTGEKPHECDICGTAFRRSGDMWKHKRTLHGIHANNIDDK